MMGHNPLSIPTKTCIELYGNCETTSNYSININTQNKIDTSYSIE